MEIQVLTEKELLQNKIKIYGNVDEPLFLAKDVANWIDHSDLSRMMNLVDDEEKLKRTIYVSGQNREMWFLTEDGLYEVLMQSRKPIAKSLKKQIKNILKTIRKTGGYVAENKTADFIDNYFPTINEELKLALVKDLNTQIKKLQTENLEKQQIIEEQKPKVEYHDTVLHSKKLITVTDVAKDLGLSAQKLNKILKDNKILFKQSKIWKPYENYSWLINDGYMDYHINEFGQVLKFTEKGRQWLIESVQKEQIAI